jgi:DEAD/DEAH box helicase domain-containing protein
VGDPAEMAAQVTGRSMVVIDEDAGPHGARTYVFWNPPIVRGTTWRSRRSANVEAHELMARLIASGAPTITFSKAKMTAELIHRYVAEELQRTAPQLARRVVPYRGGYLADERRDIERRLFSGELLGVSTTPALELGIDVGGLDAAILVGYPGTLASFFQQASRAGRRDRESLVVLVGLDTPANQYIMRHPEYVLGRPIERTVVDPDNPYVVIGHLRCATQELPLPDADTGAFGPYADLALRVLEDNRKVRHVGGAWRHAAKETPQHEVGLREYADATVVIQDADTGLVLGEVNEFDAQPILHPEAIYMHLGDTFRVLSLDTQERVAVVKREQTDYYTQPLGGTDVHHIDACLREKPFGTGRAFWGEVTAYFRNDAYEKIRFYTLDAIETHGLDLPHLALETMAFWIVPPEDLMVRLRRDGLDLHRGLRGIGYAVRMALPLHITCDTADFSHSIGSANSPWNAIFVYERYPHGLGFTEAAYERLHEILPAVLETIRACPCADGCPCCTGKPLRQFTTWNVERGEGGIPSKRAAIRILEGLLGDGAHLNEPDTSSLSDGLEASRTRLEISLRRRLERMREPKVFHAIEPNVPLGVPAPETPETLRQADVERRVARRSAFDKELRKRMAQKGAPQPAEEPPPAETREGDEARDARPTAPDAAEGGRPATPIKAGDELAARARRLRNAKPHDG